MRIDPLRRRIDSGTLKVLQKFIGVSGARAEVNYFELKALRVHQDVLVFDVTMQNAARLHRHTRIDNLLEK